MIGRTTAMKAVLSWGRGLVVDSVCDNPIVTKELRSRMRGAKAHLLMAGYVMLLGTVMIIAYAVYTSITLAMGHRGVGWPFGAVPRIGVILFTTLTWTQAILMGIMAPLLTTGAISREHEKRTYEMLALAPLSPRDIVAGKLCSAMAFVMMLLASSLPLAGICLMLGGISLSEILVTFLILASWAFLLTSVGLMFSSLISNTVGATMVAVIAVFMYAQNVLPMGVMAFGPMRAIFGGAPNLIFMGLSAGGASNYALDTAPVLGVPVPIAAVGFAANTAMGFFFLTIAMTRLRFRNYKGAVAIRLQLLGLTLIGAFLLFGSLFSTGGAISGMNNGIMVAIMFGSFWAMVGPFIPLFASSEVLPKKGLFLSIISGSPIRSIFKLDLAGGFRFMITWTVAWCAVVGLVMALAATGGRSISPITVRDWTNAGQCAVVLLATVLGMTSVGILASALVRSRVGSGIATLIMMMIAVFTFPVMWGSISAYAVNWQSALSPIWFLAYFWPGTMIVKVVGEWKPGKTVPAALLPTDYTWLACTIAWLLVAMVAFALAGRIIHRRRGTSNA